MRQISNIGEKMQFDFASNEDGVRCKRLRENKNKK
jgi:hypothetical protein